MVTALYPKVKISEAMVFISEYITIQCEKYGHGSPLNNFRLSAFRVMLPAIDAEMPDWNYMEQYVKILFDKFNLQYLCRKIPG